MCELEVRHIAGRAPAIVLLHEGLGCVATWRQFPEALAERTGCAVIAYSRRGYGASPPCPLPRDVGYMHDEADGDLPALIETLGLSAFVLLGHSDGASIATIYAGTRPAPGLRGLILIAPHFFVEELTLTSIRRAGEAYRSRLRAALARYHGDNVDGAFHGWHDVWLSSAFRSWNIIPELDAVRVPMLVLQGRDDPYGSAAQVTAASRARAVWIDGCGHSPHRQAPETTLAHCAEFVAGIR